jgi:hypothetical protein
MIFEYLEVLAWICSFFENRRLGRIMHVVLDMCQFMVRRYKVSKIGASTHF